MKTTLSLLLLLLIAVGCSEFDDTTSITPPTTPPTNPGVSVTVPTTTPTTTVTTATEPVTTSSLVTFGSEATFQDYLRVTKMLQPQQGNYLGGIDDGAVLGNAAPTSAPSVESDTSITNNQVSGVDEGGIVKSAGEFLVVLRRGRLFTIRVSEGTTNTLKAVSSVPAYPEGSSEGTWYDELLIYKKRVVVVGYSYRASATEIGLFDLADSGKITHVSTHFLSSNDYYSSRNYASRLVEGTLVFYMPYYLFIWGRDDASLPGIRRFGATEVTPLLDPKDIYKPLQPTYYPSLHTVVRCDLTQADLSCNAAGVLGPYSRSFYVSRDAVYLWVSSEYGFNEDAKTPVPATVYRLPLVGGTPSAVEAFGSPIDQFSFHEQDGTLNVLVRNDGYGDAMWHPEIGSGDLALMRISLSQFGATPYRAKTSDYTKLPTPAGYTLQNRFVGDKLLYGTGSNWWYDETAETSVYVTNYGGKITTEKLELTHGVERIESLGSAAVVIGGNQSDLIFSAIRFDDGSYVADTFTQKNAVQGETRSHGFFFKPLEAGGILGLPIRKTGSGLSQLWEESASIVYLSVSKEFTLSTLGSLTGTKNEEQPNDQCVMSCVDWYGNSRPVFLGNRVLALIGYEFIEGQLGDGTISETARLNFMSPGE